MAQSEAEFVSSSEMGSDPPASSSQAEFSPGSEISTDPPASSLQADIIPATVISSDAAAVQAVTQTTPRFALPAVARRVIPLAGGALALILAGFAEMRVEAGDKSAVSMILYLIAIACFILSAWPLPATAYDMPAASAADLPAVPTRRRWIVPGIGVALAVILQAIALNLIKQDIKTTAGAWLWLVSMLLLLATGVVVGKRFGWQPRWGGQLWPSGRMARWLLVGTVIGIVVVASLARLLALDSVPYGINADEGDMGALSIQIVRGINTDSIFSAGWYYMSVLYFWLMAGVMQIFGVGFVQARLFSAFTGIITVAVITWIGMRHFGWRVGVMAGGLMALLGVALQFSRETSDSGPTAMLWAISAALFLEAARTGRLWAWVGAGLSGGLSIYFYPTGRLWAVVAVGYCVYLFIHGLGGRRWAILGGSMLAGLASIFAVAPFMINALHDINTLIQRAAGTSIFNGDNPTRLNYYQPGWSIWQLLREQVIHSIGIFNNLTDGNGFWPTQQPLMSGALAVFTLIGLGWVSIRIRDPRFVMLSLWFWVGFVGVIVTVETPDLQRMATAVPVLALFVALVLDSMIRRVAALVQGVNIQWARSVPIAATAVSLVVVALLMAEQGRFYFGSYGSSEHWPWPSHEGQAVNAQGNDTLVVGIGRKAHEVNSGWVRLLAPNTPRGAVSFTGSNLPLPLPPLHNLAFFVFFNQDYYLPYLQDVYPIGSSTVYTSPTEGKMFTIYRTSKADWAATQGATATPPQARGQRVDALGQAPTGWSQYPTAMRWTAGLRVSQYWNYALQIGPGPAQLSIDGIKVLTVPTGTTSMSTTLSLANGIHAIVYDGNLSAAGQPALFQWATMPQVAAGQTAPPLAWQSPPTQNLLSAQTAPQGFYQVYQIATQPDQHRLVSTLASESLRDEIHPGNNPFTATMTATLMAPASGSYSMTTFTQGLFDLKVDGNSVLHTDKPDDAWTGGSVSLTAGPHTVSIVYHVTDGPGGLEWTWIPPNGIRSIVPPAVLSPSPLDAGVAAPVDATTLGQSNFQPVDQPLFTVP